MVVVEINLNNSDIPVFGGGWYMILPRTTYNVWAHSLMTTTYFAISLILQFWDSRFFQRQRLSHKRVFYRQFNFVSCFYCPKIVCEKHSLSTNTKFYLCIQYILLGKTQTENFVLAENVFNRITGLLHWVSNEKTVLKTRCHKRCNYEQRLK